jgi:sulfur carrier protein
VTPPELRLKINGKAEIFPQETIGLSDYLAAKGIRPETVAVEINLIVIDKARYAQTVLREGDEVEIVRFVGGGA